MKKYKVPTVEEYKELHKYLMEQLVLNAVSCNVFKPKKKESEEI